MLRNDVIAQLGKTGHNVATGVLVGEVWLPVEGVLFDPDQGRNVILVGLDGWKAAKNPDQPEGQPGLPGDG